MTQDERSEMQNLELLQAYTWCETNGVDISFWGTGKSKKVRLTTTDANSSWLSAEAPTLPEAVSAIQKKVGRYKA